VIPLRDQEAIRERFATELKGPVKIDLFTQRPAPVFVPGREECAFCEQMGQVLEEIAHLSDRIELRVHEFGEDRALEERYGVERVPATVVRGVLNRPLVHYGFVGGVLFSVLLEAIVSVSGPAPDPPPMVKRKLKRLKRPVRVQVFTIPSDTNGAVQARTAQVVSLSTQHVRAEVVELAEFPRLAEQYGIREVPTTIIDDKIRFVGVFQPEELVEQIARAAERHAIDTRRTLITGPSDTSTPLPAPPSDAGTTRPSGLIIPGRS